MLLFSWGKNRKILILKLVFLWLLLKRSPNAKSFLSSFVKSFEQICFEVLKVLGRCWVQCTSSKIRQNHAKKNPCKRQKPCKKNKIHVLNVVMSLGGVHLQPRSPTLEFLSSDSLLFHPSVSHQPLLSKTLKQGCIMSNTNAKLLKSPLFPTPASRRPLPHTLNEPQAGLHKCQILHTWWNWDRFADSNSICKKWWKSYSMPHSFLCFPLYS